MVLFLDFIHYIYYWSHTLLFHSWVLFLNKWWSEWPNARWGLLYDEIWDLLLGGLYLYISLCALLYIYLQVPLWWIQGKYNLPISLLHDHIHVANSWYCYYFPHIPNFLGQQHQNDWKFVRGRQITTQFLV